MVHLCISIVMLPIRPRPAKRDTKVEIKTKNLAFLRKKAMVLFSEMLFDGQKIAAAAIDSRILFFAYRKLLKAPRYL